MVRPVREYAKCIVLPSLRLPAPYEQLFDFLASSLTNQRLVKGTPPAVKLKGTSTGVAVIAHPVQSSCLLPAPLAQAGGSQHTLLGTESIQLWRT